MKEILNRNYLNLLSDYRPQLMGIASIMIILCHAVSYGIDFHPYFSKALIYGNYGVDIFLLLSGLGCFFSLSKQGKITSWYIRRMKRILIPYILIQVPFYIYWILIGDFHLFDQLYILSTLKYWHHHQGAWFVALLIPLYLITPIIFKILNSIHGNMFVITIIILVTVASFYYPYYRIEHDNTIYNIFFAVKRCISFILGMYISPCLYKCRISTFYICILSLFSYIVLHVWFPSLYFEWLLTLPICMIACTFILVIKKCVILNKTLLIMGAMSLESYLANIYLKDIMTDLCSRRDNGIILLPGKYVEYALVMTLGIAIAYIINIMCQYYTKK